MSDNVHGIALAKLVERSIHMLIRDSVWFWGDGPSL